MTGRFLVLLCALCIVTNACGDDSPDGEGASPDGGSAPSACDPLNEQAEPIELARVLGAGRDRSGVVYVVDEPARSDLRAFSSDAMTLVRSRVDTIVLPGTGVERYALTIAALPNPYTLIVEREGDESRIARTLVRGREDTPISELSSSELLENVDVATLDDYELRDFPFDIVIEYLARAPSGELLVVLRPTGDLGADFSTFRLFYGPEAALIERDVLLVQRQRDGGSTNLIFVLDGQRADAFFAVVSDGGTFRPGEATLDVDGDVVTLERLDPAADADLLGPASFECLR